MLLRSTDRGLYCEAGDFHIDPWLPVERAIITHAHDDHARWGSQQYLAARAGERVLRTRFGPQASITTVEYGEPITLNDVHISLHPAGHILGSSQIRVEHRGEVWVASGDYKTEPDETCAPFELVRCPTFITESTFGLPIYRWMPQRDTFAAIQAWWRANAGAGRASIIFAYALGKAQRLLNGLWHETEGPVYTHGAVERLNADYRDSGVDPDPVLQCVSVRQCSLGTAHALWELAFTPRVGRRPFAIRPLEAIMITRFDKLQTELPHPDNPSPNSAAAVQELLGGKFGEMSTFMNYTFQSFNFRGRKQMRPFYDLIANIAAEEFGHIELVSYTINLLLTGITERGSDPAETPLKDAVDNRNSYHYLASGQQALPLDSQGKFWTGENVFSSGNLKLDLLHNFFLECGARANKIRVYETVDDVTARACVGFLLVRGGVHIVAYAKALEKLTGVDVGKLLPIPDISNKRFPEAAKHEANGLHRILYQFSPEDYPRAGEIWNGEHPEDGSTLEMSAEMPEGFEPPDLEEEPQLTAPVGPDIDPEMFKDVAKRLFPEMKPGRKRSSSSKSRVKS